MKKSILNLLASVIAIILFAISTGLLIGKCISDFSVVSLICLIVEAILLIVYTIDFYMALRSVESKYQNMVDERCDYRDRMMQAEDWIENLVFLHFDDDGNIKDVDELKKDIYWHAVNVGTKWNKD